jgi:hypothetical protein
MTALAVIFSVSAGLIVYVTGLAQLRWLGFVWGIGTSAVLLSEA